MDYNNNLYKYGKIIYNNSIIISKNLRKTLWYVREEKQKGGKDTDIEEDFWVRNE